MQTQLQMIGDLLARHEIKKAEISAARLLRTPLAESDKSSALVLRARARLLSGRPDEALDDLKAAFQLTPERSQQPQMLELLADCHLLRFEMASVGFADRSDTDQAYNAYYRIVTQNPRYPNIGWVYYQLGRIALTNNDIPEADRLFRQSLFTPSHVAALTAYCFERLGFIAFYEKRDMETALGLVDKAIFTYPSAERPAWLVQVHILRSRILRAMGQYHEALAAAEVAVTIGSNGGAEDRSVWAEALLAAGELASGLPDRQRETVTHLQQFLQISRKPLGVDVTWSRVYEMLGDAYFALSLFEQASGTYRSALQYNPDHPWETSLLHRIARACYHQQNYEEAVAAIQQLIRTAQADGEPVTDYQVYDILANALFAQGRYSEAVSAYQAALDLAPPNAVDLDKIRRYSQFARELS